MPGVPVWFQADYYFENKLASMPYATAEDGARQLMDAFNSCGYPVQGLDGAQLNASAAGLYRHFVDYGNAENISPNGYFDLATYRANKLAQVKEIGQPVPQGFDAWSDAALDAAMKEAGLSYWDHYTRYGTEEGINPSAQFNTNDYLAAKLAQLNSLEPPQPLPDGSIGIWTRADLCQALRDADLNALEHYEVYHAEEGTRYTPEAEAPVAQVLLTTGNDVVSDDGIPTSFVGELGSSASTLNPGDQITGTNPGDALDVTISENWSGFDEGGFMRGVPNVNIDNATGYELAFYADGIEGAKTFNVDGAVSLYGLASAGIAVNYSNLDSAVSVDFADSAISGNNDSLTLGLNNVRSAQGMDAASGEMAYAPVAISAGGIERLAVRSTGSVENRVSLAGVDEATALTVAGDAALRVHDVAASVATIDAGAATGDVDINAVNAVLITGATLGAGDDRLTVGNIRPNATVAGGAGSDDLVFTQGGTYALKMSGVEIATAGSGSADLVFDGSGMRGLETLRLDGMTGDVTLANLNQGLLTVRAEQTNSGKVAITGVSEIRVNAGDGDQAATFSGDLIAPDARSLSLNAGQNGTISLGSGSDLSGVSRITLSGYNDIAVDPAASLGGGARAITVNAEDLVGGDIDLVLSANTTAGGARLDYIGSSTGDNTLTVGSGYKSVSFQGGVGNDALTVDSSAGKVVVTGDMGVGDNAITINGAGTVDVSGLGGNYGSTLGAGATAMLGGGTVDITMNGSGAVEFTEQGGSASITAAAAGGTIDIASSAIGVKADVTAGAGTDIFDISMPDVGKTAADAGFMAVQIDDFNTTNDKLDLPRLTNWDQKYDGSSALLMVPASGAYGAIRAAGFAIADGTLAFLESTGHIGWNVAIKYDGDDAPGTLEDGLFLLAAGRGGSETAGATVVYLQGVSSITTSTQFSGILSDPSIIPNPL